MQSDRDKKFLEVIRKPIPNNGDVDRCVIYFSVMGSIQDCIYKRGEVTVKVSYHHRELKGKHQTHLIQLGIKIQVSSNLKLSKLSQSDDFIISIDTIL